MFHKVALIYLVRVNIQTTPAAHNSANMMCFKLLLLNMKTSAVVIFGEYIYDV
jgi:hypothetical protein